MLDSVDSAAELAYRSEHNVMPERKRMQSHAKLSTIRARRPIGVRRLRRAMPPRYQDEDLAVFQYMSKLSLQAAGRYIDRLLGPR